MGRGRAVAFLFAAAAAGAAVTVRRHGAGMGRSVAGGILVRNAGAYDRLSHRLLLGSLFRGIAADVAATAPDGARVLEVGCGPGHLAIRLAVEHALDVTGLDLDPAMNDLARANAIRAESRDERRPSFLVGDVGALPFPDESFDLVVSTLSMHHWADPPAGLAEIGRVLRPDGRAVIWDFRPGFTPLHAHMPDPLEHVRGVPLRLVQATPWPWPWRFHLTQRMELAREPTGSGHS